MDVIICGGHLKGPIRITGPGGVVVGTDSITIGSGSIAGSAEFDGCTANMFPGDFVVTGGSLTSAITIHGGAVTDNRPASITVTGGTNQGCFSATNVLLSHPSNP